MSLSSAAFSLVRRLMEGEDEGGDVEGGEIETIYENWNVCPKKPAFVEDHEILPIVGNLKFHDLAIVLSASAGFVACVLSWVLIARHATHYCAPGEQKQIMRVAYLIQWFVFVSFLGVIFEEAAPYLKPLLLIGESFTVAAFLLFLCNCVLSNEDGFERMFRVTKYDHLHHLRHMERRYSHMREENYSGPTWLKLCWYLAIQLIPVSIIVFIITVVSKATGWYCNTSNSFAFSKSWIAWIENISIVLAVAGEIYFHVKQSDQLRPHGAWRKMIAFKSIVVVNALQLTIITALAGYQAIQPSEYMTWDDVVYGLPNLVICCEMPLFALLFLWTFRIAPYRITEDDDPREYRGGRFGLVAMGEALNIADILSTFIRGPVHMLKHQEQMVEKHGLDLEAIAAHKSTPYLSRSTSRTTSRANSLRYSETDTVSMITMNEEGRRSRSTTRSGGRSVSRPTVASTRSNTMTGRQYSRVGDRRGRRGREPSRPRREHPNFVFD
ncbi:hypothetical protein EJ05DRAFT_509836 [Pseudovirgaria hyperparasitica]|uniref:DUF300-domain-containing protein n=1 Tax=Pseudovirgaria hyperparasitica TaxID=470096 RepID=A0A6A6W9X1_9PEZI|nr:uncharacterized protein EJ05DRAFT_509836 [Pseudovirgaria hyperparasitica]KAF2758959.1 hypothetical protein EJ05DRAFT_509836 [Pseudovirgaria hyperparasitica]